MKTFSVSNKTLKMGSRLLPSFYYYTEILKSKNQLNGVKYYSISDFAIVSDGEHSAIPRNSQGGIRYLYGRNIKEGVINFDEISDDSYISEDDYLSFKRCHVSENDVLIAILGTIGKSALYKQEYMGIVGIPRHIANIKIKNKELITPEFLSLFFRSRLGKNQMFSMTTGNIQQLFSLSAIRRFEVPIPDKKIVNELTCIEKAALDCFIQAEKYIKEASIIFYKALNFNPKDIKGSLSFSKSSKEVLGNGVWTPKLYNPLYRLMESALCLYNRAVALGTIASLTKGDEVGSDNYSEFLDKTNEHVPFIRTSDLVNGEVDLYPDYYVLDENNIIEKQKLSYGDILFTKDGKVGSAAMITDEDNVIVSSGIEILRINDNGRSLGITPEVLFVALMEPIVGRYGANSRTVVASTIPHLIESRLAEIKIPLINHTDSEKITILIKKAYELKAKRKKLLIQSMKRFEEVLS